MLGPNDSSWLTILMEWMRNTFSNAPSNNPPPPNFNQSPPIQPGGQGPSSLPDSSFTSTPSMNPSSIPTPPPPPSPDFISTPTNPTNNPLPPPSFNKMPTLDNVPPFTSGTSPLTNNVSGFADKIWNNLVPNSVKSALSGHIGKVSLGTMVGFVFQLFLSIYFYMSIAGIIVVYKLFKALEKLGVLATFQNILISKVNMVFNISDNCFMKLGDLKQFWNCMQKF